MKETTSSFKESVVTTKVLEDLNTNDNKINVLPRVAVKQLSEDRRGLLQMCFLGDISK